MLEIGGLKVPKLRKLPFETAIIERYRGREASVEESLIEMYLAGVLERGLSSTQLFITDKYIGLVESLRECFPQAKWQRCTVHFYRNVFSIVPNGKVREVTAMLKAIHAQEDLESAKSKAADVIEKLKKMKLKNAAELV